MLRNTAQRYGWMAMSLHWLVALLVLGLFGLGLYMSSLTYYDPWYRLGPFWHKSFGVVLFVLMLWRVVWVLLNPKPQPPVHSPAWERHIAHITHGLLYLLLFVLMLSGYLISTADGRGVSVFDWFEIPALPWSFEHQEDVAGKVHLAIAWTLIGLVGLHVAAALKHHFIDKDSTLKRMLPWRN